MNSSTAGRTSLSRSRKAPPRLSYQLIVRAIFYITKLDEEGLTVDIHCADVRLKNFEDMVAAGKANHKIHATAER